MRQTLRGLSKMSFSLFRSIPSASIPSVDEMNRSKVENIYNNFSFREILKADSKHIGNGEIY